MSDLPRQLEEGAKSGLLASSLENIRALLPEQSLEETLHTLRDYGNMSSPSVLFALAEALREDRPSPLEDWWLTSFGAGFSAHACRLSST
jgi:alkylresorcinol/alkylpyrone synthase